MYKEPNMLSYLIRTMVAKKIAQFGEHSYMWLYAHVNILNLACDHRVQILMGFVTSILAVQTKFDLKSHCKST